MNKMNKKYLILEDGTVFEGVSAGADAETLGEIVFTTTESGFASVLTDGCFRGQLVVQTFPLVGCYGFVPSEAEGEPVLAGYIARSLCDAPSNRLAEGALSDYLKSHGIPAVVGIDTRRLTSIIREKGVMNASICDSIPENFDKIKNYRVPCELPSVTERRLGAENADYNVAVIDCGAANACIKELTALGCGVTVLPADTPAGRITGGGFDGAVLSGGAGNPADLVSLIDCAGQLLGKIPVLGIGLGHQLLAVADGAKTEKLKYGHRGSNQPVKLADGSRTYITEQNHGYTVLPDGLASGRVVMVNVNDGTVEGIDYPAKSAVSVQFNPQGRDASGTAFVYDRFVGLMEDFRNADR